MWRAAPARYRPGGSRWSPLGRQVASAVEEPLPGSVEGGADPCCAVGESRPGSVSSRRLNAAGRGTGRAPDFRQTRAVRAGHGQLTSS